MNERDRLFLNHVLSAIAEIKAFTTVGHADFMTDSKTKWFALRPPVRLLV